MKQLITLLFFTIGSTLFAQDMNNNRLFEIITKSADTVKGINGNWQFIYKKTLLICVTDENNNRMRIMTPILEAEKLDHDLLLNSLTANFHTALDVKYAISNDVLWSVFIHPLKELTQQQVEDAISQVYYAAATFGTTYTSTELIFGGGTNEEKNKKEEKIKLHKS